MTRVGFALLSSACDPAPSTRIACLNLFPHLLERGYGPEVVFDQAAADEEPAVPQLVQRALQRGCSVVVLQKIRGPQVLRAVRDLRAHGIATVYSVCDFVDDAMAAAVDRTIVVTPYLRSLYAPELQPRIDVVHDGIERPAVQQAMPPAGSATCQRPRALYVGSHPIYRLPLLGLPPAGWDVEIVAQFAPAHDRVARWHHARWTMARSGGVRQRWDLLSALLHPRLRHTAWHPDGVYDRIAAADIGILPIDTSVTAPARNAPVPAWQLKSENRLTLLMAAGLPVIATPIPSYEPVLVDGVTGFVARSPADWRRAFDALRDPAVRAALGRAARAAVIDRFSVASQADRFIQTLQHLPSMATAPRREAHESI